MKKFESILWGFVLIVLGLILGGNSLGITNIDIFFDGWWALFIIIPSFIGLFKENEKTGSIIGILIGVALLLCCQDILSFEIILKLIFPTILIIFGISMIFKDVISSKINDEIKKINANNKNNNEYSSTFSVQNINFDKEEFEGANLTAVFGGIELDLRNSIIKEDQVINCSAIFGGIDIIVPEDVNVKVKSSSVFGGIDLKKQSDKQYKKTIYVDGKCIFGGVDIK